MSAIVLSPRGRRRMLAALAVFALAVLVHLTALWALPYLATQRVVSLILERTGASANELWVAPPREAGADLVPMENPDTVTASAWLDLKDGPLVFEMSAPELALLSSLSIYEHDTDTAFWAADLPRVRVLILRTHETLPTGEFTHVVRLPSRRGFLLVRAILRDRYDTDQLERVVSSLRGASLTRLR